MPSVKLPMNMSDVEASSTFEVMPPGNYEVEINEMKLKKSAAGNDYFAITYKVINDDEFAGQKLWDNVSLVPAALFKLKQLSLACGINIEDELDTEDFLGATLEVVVDIGKNQNGEDRNEVKRYIFEEA